MKRFFLFLSVILCTLAFSANAKTYLVSVGVADYPGTQNDLRLCARDAQDVAALYRQMPGTEAIVLTNTQATKQNIINAMEKLYKKAGKNDQVMLFFSGHGIKGCFMAYDGPLSYTYIRNTMAKGKSKSKIIYADACFAGKFRNKSKKKYNEADDKKADVLLFLSSRSEEKSKEMRNMSNGLFTNYLLKGLKGGADTDHNRIITARELFNYVSKNVAQTSRNTQHPVMWGSFSNDLPLFRW